MAPQDQPPQDQPTPASVITCDLTDGSIPSCVVPCTAASTLQCLAPTLASCSEGSILSCAVTGSGPGNPADGAPTTTSLTSEMPLEIDIPVTNTSSMPGDNTSAPSSNRFSSADAGGIGAGAAIGGIVLTLLAALLFLRSRKKPRRYQSGLLADSAKKEQIVGYDHGGIDHLTPPIAHETFRQNMTKLMTDIKNLVDNVFSTSLLEIDETAETTLQAFAGPPVEGSTWGRSLHDHPQALVIRALIAQTLFKQIDPRSNLDTTLLPRDLLAVYQSFQTSAQNGTRTQDKLNRTTVLASWRQASGYLTPGALLDDQARLCSVKIADALAPLRPNSSQKFRRLLGGLTTDAAKLGFDLFKQQKEWHPVWTRPRRDKEGGIAVFPGLVFSDAGADSEGMGHYAGASMKICGAKIES